MLLLLLESQLPCVYNDDSEKMAAPQHIHSTHKPHYNTLTAVQWKKQSKSEPAYTNDDEIDNKIVFFYFLSHIQMPKIYNT